MGHKKFEPRTDWFPLVVFNFEFSDGLLALFTWEFTPDIFAFDIIAKIKPSIIQVLGCCNDFSETGLGTTRVSQRNLLVTILINFCPL